jgi:transcriptional regulator with GAF, ATPase, and Fis domain
MLVPDPATPISPGDLFLRAASGVFFELLSFNDLLHTIMNKVIEVTGATKGFLILIGPDGELEFRIARGVRGDEVERPRDRISRKLIGRVVDSGQSMLTGHAGQDPRLADLESVHNLLLKSILCVPLANERGVFGVIYLENHITAGAFDAVMQQMVERVAEQAALVLTMTRSLESLKGERDRLVLENRGLREVFRAEYEFGRVIGRSPAMARIAAQVNRVAESPHTVLVRGESGTGKEMIARVIHASGALRDKPFVAVNCAAVPTPLFESELFGHVKGAFTGADRSRVGKVEAANGGTLFLDEIGDLPREVQPKLLRLLQERTYERVGANEPRQADIRIIAATNKDLGALIEKGEFREDLYYRLNQLPVVLPPLRERPEDIDDLALHFLRQERGGVAGFTAAALEFMRRYPWPGNVRALKNVVLRAATYTTDGETIGVEAIRAQLDQRDPQPAEGDDVLRLEVAADLKYRNAVDRLEEGFLREVLKRHPGLSRAELANRLGMPRRTLFHRLRDLGITGADEE